MTSQNRKQLEIRIKRDGMIESKTINIKGKKCLSYIEFINQLVKGEIQDSNFTHEYHEEEKSNVYQQRKIKLDKL